MTYSIREDYVHREHAFQSDLEIEQTDECQNETYKVAKAVFESDPSLRSVIDLGCGGAYKLLREFDDLNKEYVTGIDRLPIVNWLRNTYRGQGTWITSRLGNKDWHKLFPQGALWVCADMIEHVVDPDIVLQFLSDVRPKAVVMSTPDRDMLQEQFWLGPPKNLTHYREWTMPEFASYLKCKFKILEHFRSPDSQSTQIAILETL